MQIQKQFNKYNSFDNYQRKIRTGTKLRLRKTLKMNNCHELFLTTRQPTKIRNAFANMSTNIKLSKAHIKFNQVVLLVLG